MATDLPGGASGEIGEPLDMVNSGSESQPNRQLTAALHKTLPKHCLEIAVPTSCPSWVLVYQLGLCGGERKYLQGSPLCYKEH